MTASAPHVLGDAETDTLFLPLLDYSSIYVAVSGGADSTALMHLLAGWHRRQRRPDRRIVVLTVDHRLRPEAAAEADGVAAQAARLGFSHKTLVWTGVKPAQGLQAAARDARYRLLAQHIALERETSAAPDVLVTAHTADDQAETVLMRLQRGSGVDGLAAIPKHSRIPVLLQGSHSHAVTLLRPLLAIEHRRLLATLEALGVAWAEDPSNHNPRFERVRVRTALATLTELGFSPQALRRTAERMQTAQAALHIWQERAITSTTHHIHGSVFTVDLDGLAGEPAEIGIRVLRRLVDTAGGAAAPVELSKLEAAYQRLLGCRAAGAKAFTLGGTIIDPFRDQASGRWHAWIYREPGRNGGPEAVLLRPGEQVNWDQRFFVQVAPTHPDVVEIGPLGGDWPAIRTDHPTLQSLPIPSAAARSLPVFRHFGRLVAAPTLAEFAREKGDDRTALALEGPRCKPQDGGNVCLTAEQSAWLDPRKIAAPDCG